ncbi:MAG TPA: glutathione S-transferase N-terminal domain-containing protein [Polyangiaceae bacterium]|nr:glutathione S-transferase N-terminal domain-containing protein [Polyangiaceae bacterium]
MKLYASPASPFVRKVLVLAHEVGLRDRIEVIPVVLSPIAPSATLTAKNPLGKIPARELDAGEVLVDSRVICEHLDLSHAGRPMIPREPDARRAVLTTQALADGAVDAGILVRYETVLRPEPYRWPEWVAGQCNKVLGALRALDARAPDIRDELDLGQIAAACAVGWLEFRRPLDAHPQGPIELRREFPALYAFWDRVSARPSFVATVPS